MKKKLIILFMFVSLLGPVTALPATAGAIVLPGCNGKASNTQYCQETKKSGNPVIKALKVALQIIAIIVGFAAVVMIIIGGLKLITSTGDPSSVKSGRDTIIYALIGVVVALFAQAIVSFVLAKL